MISIGVSLTVGNTRTLKEIFKIESGLEFKQNDRILRYLSQTPIPPLWDYLWVQEWADNIGEKLGNEMGAPKAAEIPGFRRRKTDETRIAIQ